MLPCGFFYGAVLGILWFSCAGSAITVPSSGNVSLDDRDTAWSNALPTEVGYSDTDWLHDGATYASTSTSVAPNVSAVMITPPPPGRTSCSPAAYVDVTRTVVYTVTFSRHHAHHGSHGCRCSSAVAPVKTSGDINVTWTHAASDTVVVPVYSIANRSSVWSSPSLSPVSTFLSLARQEDTPRLTNSVWMVGMITMGMTLL
ncbi:hypothetical protein LTR70_007660 [Exophiala xenobiotica]|uniref:Uncharacterized protein n=1 Tax=Lithohypha guttulata TaxID=1690604 RepID=A0ABR0K1K5_9EURO|nr:hypothetical protein LTR24_007929 [Lithohypha guttulata]KAK5313356.1 hypothetical protein LTR70_007660 [Exophiala xenobiotica]